MYNVLKNESGFFSHAIFKVCSKWRDIAGDSRLSHFVIVSCSQFQYSSDCLTLEKTKIVVADTINVGHILS